ncbi:MAG TPA: hypothetical protein VNE16_09980 [Vicinamibacterales bacterium]|nr:hypothetical protein [Vicinamibacterales bacterium]
MPALEGVDRLCLRQRPRDGIQAGQQPCPRSLVDPERGIQPLFVGDPLLDHVAAAPARLGERRARDAHDLLVRAAQRVDGAADAQGRTCRRARFRRASS